MKDIDYVEKLDELSAAYDKLKTEDCKYLKFTKKDKKTIVSEALLWWYASHFKGEARAQIVYAACDTTTL